LLDAAPPTRAELLKLMQKKSSETSTTSQLVVMIRDRVGDSYAALLEPGDVKPYSGGRTEDNLNRALLCGILLHCSADTVRGLVERGVITRELLRGPATGAGHSGVYAAAHANDKRMLGAIAPLLEPADLLQTGVPLDFTAYAATPLKVARGNGSIHSIPPDLLRKATQLEIKQQLGESAVTRAHVLTLLRNPYVPNPAVSKLLQRVYQGRGDDHLRLLEPGDIPTYYVGGLNAALLSTILANANSDTIADLVARGVITRAMLLEPATFFGYTGVHIAAEVGELRTLAPILEPEDLLVPSAGTVHGKADTPLSILRANGRLNALPPNLLRQVLRLEIARKLGESTAGDRVRDTRAKERLSSLFWAVKVYTPDEALRVLYDKKLTADDLSKVDPYAKEDNVPLLSFIVTSKNAAQLGAYVKPLITTKALTTPDDHGITPLHLALFNGTAALVMHLVTPEMLLLRTHAGVSALTLLLAAIKAGPGGTTMKGQNGTEDVVVDPKLIRQATALQLAQQESASKLVTGLLG
jgi:hypothetical protein